MNLKDQRAAALSAAQDLITGAKAAGRDLTSDETATVEAKFAEVEGFDTQIKAAADSDALMKRLGSYGDRPSAPMLLTKCSPRDLAAPFASRSPSPATSP